MGMWLHVDEDKVEDLESGNIFAIKGVDDERKVRTWTVVHYVWHRSVNTVLASGYKTRAEAADALAQLLSELGIEPARIQPPVTEEEIAETEDNQ
jgi:hypothetical protein